MEKVRNRLKPFLNSTFNNIEQLNQKIKHITQLLKDTMIADRGKKNVDEKMPL